MKLWIKITAGAVPSAAVLLFAILLIRCRLRRKVQQPFVSPQSLPQFNEAATKSKFGNIHAGINKFHLSYKSGSSERRSLRFHHLNHHHHTPAISPASPFSWEEHPPLITEAVETGWPRFAFSSSTPRASSGQFRAFCEACDGGAESSWEVPPSSSEYMQTVKLNPIPNKTADDRPYARVRTSLPLPGPALGGSFPQEAYFEITIICLQQREKLHATASKRSKDHESDLARLNRVSSSAGLIFASQGQALAAEQGSSGDITVTVGLISRSSTSPGQAMPGTFPGSIGFHSDGSVYLDGRKLAESEKAGWAAVNRVIGCGFDPGKRQVFFTVDSNLTHVIRCTSPAFSSPLYPVLSAAGASAMLLVNLGQAPFKYAPANAMRAPNPCFSRPPSGDGGSGAAAGAMDSRELFSVSKVEADWTEIEKRSRRRYNSDGSKKGHINLDESFDAESDLFEISLQS